MTLASLLPLAGAAIAPVLEKVIDGVTEGLSFLDVLHQPEQADESGTVPTAEPSTLEQDLAELADRLHERCAQLGIDLTTPLRLKQDGREGVVVDGDHPDRVLVESIFGTDTALTQLFNAVVAAATDGLGESDAGITTEFRLVVDPTDALIEFA